MGTSSWSLSTFLPFALLLALASADSYSNSNKNSSSFLSSNQALSYLQEKPDHLPNLLKRQKRWLIFELGTSLTMTANCAKALLDTIPRGLVLLAEATVIYDMPGAIEDWFPRRKNKPKLPPPPPPAPAPPPPPPPPLPATVPKWPTPVLPAPVFPADPAPFLIPQQPLIVPLSPADPVHAFYLAYPGGIPSLEHRKSYVNQVHSGCPASQLVKDTYGNYYCRPTALSRRLQRSLQKNGANLLNQSRSPHGMLFDLLAMLSKIHHYQPRYCIMRTLCESRHLLAAPGQSLFHDIFRILLRYVHPEIAQKPTYRKAFTAGHSLPECALWYGAQCPQSFLLHFSAHFQLNNKPFLNKVI